MDLTDLPGNMVSSVEADSRDAIFVWLKEKKRQKMWLKM